MLSHFLSPFICERLKSLLLLVLLLVSPCISTADEINIQKDDLIYFYVVYHWNDGNIRWRAWAKGSSDLDIETTEGQEALRLILKNKLSTNYLKFEHLEFMPEHVYPDKVYEMNPDPRKNLLPSKSPIYL